MIEPYLDQIALFFLIFASIAVFYGVIAIHDIPYEIAKKRNHPHLEAIHYAGWVSLFTLHVIWPFLWIWATLWDKDKGWGNGNRQKEAITLMNLSDFSKELPNLEARNAKLIAEVESLKSELKTLSQRLADLEKKRS